MARSASAVLLILVIAACTSAGVPSPSVTSQPTASQSPEPAATESAEGSPELTAVPLPTWQGHPAAGLAYVRTTDPDTGATQVFIVEDDGSERQVTGVSGNLGASFPVWSPDGSQLAFGAPKIGSTGIKGLVGVVNADGSGERQLGEGGTMRWSPDGTRISFTEVDDVTSEPISHYVVDVASGEITDLGEGYDARWLGDDRLVFVANEFAADGAVTQVTHVVTLSTGEHERVAEATTVVPSPDGTKVLMVHEGVVSLAGADFSNPVEIASGGGPVWSPDGSMFAVDYDFDEQANPIYAVVDLEGRTIQSGITGYRPVWSPDNTRIAVELFRPEGTFVQVVEVASGDVIFEVEGEQPAWRP